MTREEAVAVLEAFIENPLFSNTHKAAFNIAIHDIKQRHDWDINNLILINKENYEPIDREILDKIITEINGMYRVILKGTPKDDWAVRWNDCLDEVLQIINKYRNEVSE